MDDQYLSDVDVSRETNVRGVNICRSSCSSCFVYNALYYIAI